jgi:hypothetical protein
VIAGLTATFDNANIRVSIPARIATAWIESDQTGIEECGALGLLIEKDFQCLHRGAGAGGGFIPKSAGDYLMASREESSSETTFSDFMALRRASSSNIRNRARSCIAISRSGEDKSGA